MRIEPKNRVCSGTLVTTAALLTLFVFGRAVSASGQTPPAPPLPAQSQAELAGPTLKISADEAVRMALEENLGIQSQRLTPQIQDYAVAASRAAFAPIVFSNINQRSSARPPSSFLETTSGITTNKSFYTEAGVTQLLPFGATYTVSLDGTRSQTTAFTNFDPQLSSTLDASFRLPLVRNFRIDSARQALWISRKDRAIADVTLQQTITATTRRVRNAYYDLIAAYEGLKVQQQSLDLARESLKNNQAKLEVGTMAPIDIVEAEAEVARNEESVIVADAGIRRAEDQLRVLIMDPRKPDFWTLHIEPTDQPTLQARPIDLDAAVTSALANRTDLVQARKLLESTDIVLKYLHNQKLPAVDLTATYGTYGLGGTQLVFDQTQPFPYPVLSSSQRGFGTVLRDVFGNDFRNWSVGFQIGYPIRMNAAAAALARTRLQQRQDLTDLRTLELAVVQSVRQVARDVNTNLKRVQSTQSARQLAEKRLDAERRKFAVGMTDTFRVFQAQRDLATARNSELNAIIAYNKSLVDFEAVQVAPLGGS